MIRFNDRSSGMTHAVPTTAPAGQTVTVTIGGTGRPVVGKLDLPADVVKKGWISWDTRINTPHKQLKAPPIPKTLKSQDEIRKWYEDWMKTPEGKTYQEESKKEAEEQRQSYAFVVKPDGSFRADDIPAGPWELTMQIYPGDTLQRNDWGNPIGSVRKLFTIPEMPGGRSDEPLDLGSLYLVSKDAQDHNDQ
jgi:hypothetical protein